MAFLAETLKLWNPKTENAVLGVSSLAVGLAGTFVPQLQGLVNYSVPFVNQPLGGLVLLLFGGSAAISMFTNR